MAIKARIMPTQGRSYRSKSLVDSETAYLKSIPGMAEKIKRGMETPLSECFEIEVTREMLGI